MHVVRRKEGGWSGSFELSPPLLHAAAFDLLCGQPAVRSFIPNVANGRILFVRKCAKSPEVEARIKVEGTSMEIAVYDPDNPPSKKATNRTHVT